MSKLFNTLEQIRQNESQSYTPLSTIPDQNSADKWRWKRRTIIAVVSVLAVFLLLVALPSFISLNQTGQKSQSKIAWLGNAFFSKNPPTPKSSVGVVRADTRTIPKSVQTIADQALNIGKKTASPSTIDPIMLNNQGAKTIQQQDYWKGIYLLNTAMENTPDQVEPIINLAVALTEIGLHGPAKRLFTKAKSINPKHPQLLENFKILANSGMFDETALQPSLRDR